MATKQLQLTPLAQEARTAITTAEAAAHLNRSTQTLWLWACKETGPIRPVRVMRRLAWPVADLKRALGLPDADAVERLTAGAAGRKVEG